MNVTIHQLKLVMWQKKEMPVRKKDEQTGEWVKTDQVDEKTEYTLRDEWGDVLKFIAGNEYREFEGSTVEAQIAIEFNEWQNKNTVKLVSIQSDTEAT